MKEEVFEGDLTVKSGEVYGYSEITGTLIVPANTEAFFPKLEKVGGYVYARENAKLSLPKVTSVGGSVDASANAKLSLPKVTSVGGHVDASVNAKLSLPNNVKKNDPDNNAAEKCRAMLLSSFAAAGFSFADGILARIVSKRGPVSKVIICGKTEVSYLVTDGEAYSHGKTLAEARDGLMFKIGSRDTSEFKAWSLDKEVSKRDAIRAYRCITGACEGGVRAWLEQRQTPEKITVQGVIDLTKGAYGAEQFKAFFAGAK